MYRKLKNYTQSWKMWFWENTIESDLVKQFQFLGFNRNMLRALLATFWHKSGSHRIIVRPITVKNVRGIPQTETIHKVTNVVTKLGFLHFFKARSHERLNRCDCVTEGTLATQSLIRVHSCQSQRLSCGVAATNNSLWTCSKYNNQSLVVVTGLLIWTSSCWNLARFHCFATFHEKMNTLFSDSQ